MTKSKGEIDMNLDMVSRNQQLIGYVKYIVGAFVVTCLIVQLSMYEAASEADQFHVADIPQCALDPHVPLWEQPSLINLDNFYWIQNNESKCSLDHSEKHLRIAAVIVHTRRSAFRERLAIRNSWGSLPIYKNWTLRFAFLLGQPDPSKNSTYDLKQLKIERRKLAKEQKQFGDVVIGSFVDSYHNLTYKHMMGYKWVLSYCSKAQFVLKTDDDVFFDIMRWLDWRTQDLKMKQINSSLSIPDLYGFEYGYGKPIRDEKNKWYASYEDYPDDNPYPSYTSGCGYGITVDLIRKMYLATQNVRFFWIDDAYTGLIRNQVEKEEPNNKPYFKRLFKKVSTNPRDYAKMCKTRDFSSRRLFRSVAWIPRDENLEMHMMCMWNKTLHDTKYKFDS